MRDRARSRRVHDWRLTLLPAAIENGQHLLALRVCKALCERQQGFHPEVFVGTRELAEELGVDRAQMQREIRLLQRAKLLAVVVGGGRLAVPRGKAGKANVYRLGAALGRSVDAVINGDTHVALEAPDTATPVSPFWGKLELATATPMSPHPSGVLRTPSGDRGFSPPLHTPETGPPADAGMPSQSSRKTAGSRRRAVLDAAALSGQPTITPPGLRGLFRDLDDPRKKG